MEKVGEDNFFHHFYDSKDFLRNSWKKSKKLAWLTFSTICAAKTAGVVKNKTSSEICGKSGKRWPGQLFPRFGPPKRLGSWKMLARQTFHHFRDVYSFFRNSWSRGASNHSSRNHGKYENYAFYQEFPCFLATNFMETLMFLAKELCKTCRFPASLKPMPPKHANHR